jgi:hypothetical protein
METVRKLKDLAGEANDWGSEFLEIPLRDARFTEDGLFCNGQLLRANDECRSGLFNRVGASASYWERHTPSFSAQALTEHLKNDDFGSRPTALAHRNDLITVFRGELSGLPDRDVVWAIAEETEGEELVVTRIVRNPERMELELVSPAQAIAVRANDIIQAGIAIIHCRYGSEATKIDTYMLRLVCSNGLTHRQCVSRSALPRARRLSARNPAARDLQFEQVRRLVRHNWNILQDQLEAVKKTSERAARVENLLEHWLLRARLSGREMRERLLGAWREEGAENTYYGAINALTRVATHDTDISDRERRVLSALAGLLAFARCNLCERCFSVLARGA